MCLDTTVLPAVREVLKICAQLSPGLLAEGITKDQIKVMGREVPGKLLMG